MHWSMFFAPFTPPCLVLALHIVQLLLIFRHNRISLTRRFIGYDFSLFRQLERNERAGERESAKERTTRASLN